jgi:hypothetical protein
LFELTRTSFLLDDHETVDVLDQFTGSQIRVADQLEAEVSVDV